MYIVTKVNICTNMRPHSKTCSFQTSMCIYIKIYYDSKLINMRI